MIHPTRFSLPDEEYLTLLGEAVYVFNSNVSFFVENLMHVGAPDWYGLTDMMTGRLKDEERPNYQYQIDRELLCSFIDRNQELSDELYKCRDRNTANA